MCSLLPDLNDVVARLMPKDGCAVGFGRGYGSVESVKIILIGMGRNSHHIAADSFIRLGEYVFVLKFLE